jgi:hypothetical protein
VLTVLLLVPLQPPRRNPQGTPWCSLAGIASLPTLPFESSHCIVETYEP